MLAGGDRGLFQALLTDDCPVSCVIVISHLDRKPEGEVYHTLSL